MGYPCELEDRVHRRLGRGDLAGAQRACSRFARALRASPGVQVEVLVPLLHSSLWGVRQSLRSLFGGATSLPAREELARVLLNGDGTRVVDRYERAVATMIEQSRRDDALAASPARRARGFVDTNADGRISTASVARAVCCSEAYLCALFRDAYGTTVGEYIRARRIERAKALLEATRLPVKTVAHRAGFGTYRTFLRNFRGLTGMSPRIYRRMRTQQLAAASGSTSPRARRRRGKP